ncbi:Scr1 family TA system antitoxin-like transcriptional regulator [Streptomyces sp. NPDC102274]|uniref:Scr1 family TA system antitoxin-like transcriptional regulator n=1 Tax=Streptomyces sp. NPDC102274 TaxID=3366151 RepID=UPI0037F2CF41
MTTPTPTAAAPIVVGALLRAMRDARFKLPEEAAVHLRCSVDDITAMEDGISPPSLESVWGLLGLYLNAPREQVREVHCTLRNILRSAANPALEGQCLDERPGYVARLDALERQALAVRWRSVRLLPEPLQTPAYTQALRETQQLREHGTANRRPLLDRRDLFLVELSVLECPVVHPDQMAEQLTHLVHLMRAGNAEIRVWGTEQDPPMGLHLGELVLPGDRTLYVEHHASWIRYSTDTAAKVRLDAAQKCAEEPRASLALLTAKAEEYTLAASRPGDRISS